MYEIGMGCASGLSLMNGEVNMDNVCNGFSSWRRKNPRQPGVIHAIFFGLKYLLRALRNSLKMLPNFLRILATAQTIDTVRPWRSGFAVVLSVCTHIHLAEGTMTKLQTCSKMHPCWTKHNRSPEKFLGLSEKNVLHTIINSLFLKTCTHIVLRNRKHLSPRFSVCALNFTPIFGED